MNCDNFFYPLRPRSARSRPPILGGQLIETEEHKDRFLSDIMEVVFLETEEHKDRFLSDRMGVVFWRQKNIKTGF